jgi:nucleotide-binding universal stress UspA family protein
VLPIKNILYPVDFSTRSVEIWPVIVGMARKLQVPVTLLHALEVGDDTELLRSALEPARLKFHEALLAFSAGPGAPVSLVQNVKLGNAADCIVEAAEDLEAPLIMMPTRSHTSFREMLLGSVTTAVLQHAKCPVWTDAHPDDPAHRTNDVRSIVAAVDMGSQTPDVLRAACAFQTSLGTRLHVIHSVPGIDPRFPSATADRAHALLLANAREEFPGHCAQAGTEAALEIVEDPDLVTGIVEAASRHQANLLVIGRGVIRGSLGRLRSNAEELIRHTPCPVLSV